MEIERKFTIKQLPANLEQYPFHVIEQAYLCTDPVVRVRKQDDDYYLTYKGKGLMAREEYNLPLNRNAYEHLLAKADGTVITKKRYCIPITAPQFSNETVSGNAKEICPELTIELDIFEGTLAPLIIAEVEFPTIETANSFIAPDWFLEDVTDDPAYHNSNLSRRQR